MRKLAFIVLGVMVFSAAFVGVASAQQYPNVANLTPFAAQTNFMSLGGYLRYPSHQQINQWLAPVDARIVRQ